MVGPLVLHKLSRRPAHIRGKFLNERSIARKSQLLEVQHVFTAFPRKHLKNAYESVTSIILVTLHDGDGHQSPLATLNLCLFRTSSVKLCMQLSIIILQLRYAGSPLRFYSLPGNLIFHQAQILEYQNISPVKQNRAHTIDSKMSFVQFTHSRQPSKILSSSHLPPLLTRVPTPAV
jgi:hypothetical protein